MGNKFYSLVKQKCDELMHNSSFSSNNRFYIYEHRLVLSCSIFAILYILSCFVLHKKSNAIIFLTCKCDFLYYLYILIFFYLFIFLFCFIFCGINSKLQFTKNKKILCIMFACFCPAVIIVIFFEKISKKFLLEYPFSIIFSIYFFMFIISCVFIIIFNRLFCFLPPRIDIFGIASIIEKTYIYVGSFISIYTCNFISQIMINRLFKCFNKYVDAKDNLMREQDINKIFNLINCFLLIVLTIICKALEFSNYHKIIVDAIFYSTGIMTLLCKIKQDYNKLHFKESINIANFIDDKK
mgnify:CR=1 FL=1